MDRPCFQYTRFVDISEDGKEVEEHWGYRLYDDIEQIYNNNFGSFAEVSDVVNRRNVLQYLWDNHFDFAAEVSARGLYFGDDWMTPEDLAATVEKGEVM